MLFNSFEFLLLFLPVVFVLFWYAGSSLRWRLGFLTFASYAFYSYWPFGSIEEFLQSWRVWEPGGVWRFLWMWRFTIIMIASSSVDYFAANAMARLSVERPRDRFKRKLLLALSLAANLGLLGFFKYAGFFSAIANDLSRMAGGGGIPIISVTFAAGISFYTFESMSYVIDIYRGLAKPTKSYLDYACFISFFPHLIAGPIIRWSDILHQFRDVAWRRRTPDWPQVNIGLVFLTIGLTKKLIIADRIAAQIKPLWDAVHAGQVLPGGAAWAAVLGYTFQIYFDFSGYSDMATGLGHLFGVKLPQNFDSPYKATNISDHWRRWHMTLSAWLRDYLYFPLGGSRGSRLFVARNLVITMFLGGLWHGAAWLFIIWGTFHGVLLAGYHLLRPYHDFFDREFGAVFGTIFGRRLWERHKGWVGHWAARCFTFLLIVLGFVLFRCADANKGSLGWETIKPAFIMLGQMFGLGTTGGAALAVVTVSKLLLWMLPASWAWCNFMPNSFDVAYNLRLRQWMAVAGGAALAACMLHFGIKMDFLYFRF